MIDFWIFPLSTIWGAYQNTVFLLFFLFKFLEKGAEKGQNNYNSCNAALSVALVQECSKLVKPVPLIALE